MKNANKTFGTLSRMLCAIALTAVILFSMIACGDSGGNVPPEQLPDSERWWVYNDASSKVKVAFSVGSDDVCTITVSGSDEAVKEIGGDWWKGTAGYNYTDKQGVSYKYTFEAWTKKGDGNRKLNFQYFENNDTSTYRASPIWITEEQKTHTVYGVETPSPLAKGPALRFQCANQLGTFYVKIKKIEEYNTGKLTITNFSGMPGPVAGTDIGGMGNISDPVTSLIFCRQLFVDFENGGNWGVYNVTIEGDTVTIPVWKTNGDWTFVPFAGNGTVNAGNLSIYTSGDIWYTNKQPITFTNGNATINFKNQMIIEDRGGGGGGGPEPTEP